LTISVRLRKEIENALREDAKKQNMSISDIVNQALEKYHNEYRYFDSINAHHLDPIVVEAFFLLVDTPEKADKISTAGAVMIEKYSTYFSNGDNSFDTKLRLTVKFLKQNGIEIKQKQNGNELSLTAVHQHNEVFSNLLIGLITKLFTKTSTISAINVKDGTFSITMKTK
jgi:hypothetical protein|tara:strand:+ start:98 stop:607 length:510 start_codon:yes stop_codon:yes gene_type:complete